MHTLNIFVTSLLFMSLVLAACAPATVRQPDADGDGIADADDRCPASKAAAEVDIYGCADSDGDGIIDTVDLCPRTPLGNVVDQFGCMDSDNDGVKNGEDHCPRTAAGERVMRNGCSARQAVELESLRFEHGSTTLNAQAHERLSHLADLLRSTPQFRVALQGHSDSSGSADANYRLSRMRANKVKAALIELGVPENRITIQAYGDAMPLADNSTPEGRARNRRVALRVIRPKLSK
jgi:OOP family OmpA-OmpF porin